ncbi:MAG: dihydroorotate dehydrogenase-like protein [Candidatus Methylacidiphilales bacterium]|nr:dihydroorotate dehydrogenase-like protein [Candidatus Methylacidiphilales bacterium]
MKPYLATPYLGFNLKNPLIAGASPLGEHLGNLRRLEDLGAGAVVLHSLFEEQYEMEARSVQALTEPFFHSSPEASGYFPESEDYVLRPDAYFEQVRAAKAALGIPVIASLNGTSQGGWLDYAVDIQAAGADALELNVYRVQTDDQRSAADIEQELIDLALAVRARLKIPFVVKLSPFYSSLPHVVRRLSECAVDGVVLFNRFYQPDFDITNQEVVTRVQLSTPSALLLRLRWLAILHGRYPLALSLSGGIHRVEDIIKGIMAGADTVQLVSYLLRHGIDALPILLQNLEEWLVEQEIESLSTIRGSLSLKHCPDPSAFERAHYMKILQGWKVE